MKILFPDVRGSKGGKGSFLDRLQKELTKNGVEVVFEGPHDINFGSIRYYTKSSAKHVLRLDGVYHNTAKPWKEKNLSMRGNVDISDAVVCQSQFGYEMVKQFVGFGKADVVIINNGADPDDEYKLPEKKAEHNFLAVSKWRPHKRLEDIIESFIIADIPDSRLWVIGEIAHELSGMRRYRKKHRNIEFVGHVHDRPTLYGYMKAATASIHLCWFDCFPNSVVEAVCMGCPVICNNTGGTHEIVRPSGGIVLDIDKPYDYKPVDLYNTPKIDREKVAQAMRLCAEKRLVITSDHVDIKKIVKQYIGVFERYV